jgi:transposase
MLSHRGKAHPQALRDRVFAYADGGMPTGKIAVALLVSVSYVSKVLSRRTRTGETTARPQRCHIPCRLAGHVGVIEARVTAKPDKTLAELREWLAAEHNVSAGISLLSKTLRQLNLTVKKDAPRGRAGAARCRRSTDRLAGAAAVARPEKADLHR